MVSSPISERTAAAARASSSSCPFHGAVEDISQQLIESNVGAHYLIVYPDLTTLRELYSHYIKTALSERNEIVIVLPFFETVDTVRRILSEDGANIDVRKYEKEQSIVIIDSLKGYFGSPQGLLPFVKQTVGYAKSSDKSGVSVLGDMASFFYYQKKEGLLQYETSLPSEFEDMNLKGFCLYHKKDFDTRLTDIQKQKLFEHHGKDLIILPSTIGN